MQDCRDRCSRIGHAVRNIIRQSDQGPLMITHKLGNPGSLCIFIC